MPKKKIKLIKPLEKDNTNMSNVVKPMTFNVQGDIAEAKKVKEKDVFEGYSKKTKNKKSKNPQSS
jgi:AAA+ superfamily predicted ATPase